MFRLILVLSLSFAGLAQVAPTSQITSLSINNIENLPQMEIGVNDLLSVVVYNSPELSGTMRVSADGTLPLPMLESRPPLRVDGLLPQELAARIASELEAAHLIVRPLVTVTIAEYKSRNVSVVGAVRHPVSFQAFGDVTLFDAITRAEGVTATAGDEILITHRVSGAELKTIRRVNVHDLMTSVDHTGNVVLNGGEEIRIPEEGRISILGDVKKPGVFPIKTHEQSSLLSVLAQAEGLLPNASDSAYILRSSGGEPRRHDLQVNIRRVMCGKEADIYLEPDDILYIPDNRVRRITLSVLEHLSTMGASGASALLYATSH